MTVFAHFGPDHWLSSLLYLVPVLIVLAGIAVTSWRDRRADEQDEDGAPGPGDDPGPGGTERDATPAASTGAT